MVVASIKLNVAVHKATAIKNDDMINAKEKILSQTGMKQKITKEKEVKGVGVKAARRAER